MIRIISHGIRDGACSCEQLSVENSHIYETIHDARDTAMGGSPGELSEELVTQEKRKKGLRINYDVGEETEGLENEL